MTDTPIIVSPGLRPEHRADAARLYYEAFRQKLHPILRDEARGIAVIESCMNPAYAISALAGDRLVGIAGFHDKQGSLLNIRPQHMTRTFGFLRGWVKIIALSIFSRAVENGVLLMDGIVVDPSQRGGGIGSLLLDAVVAHAGATGYHAVRLDVVDTNPRARALYERKGFVATRSESYPFLKRWFGFGGSTTLLKQVSAQA